MKPYFLLLAFSCILFACNNSNDLSTEQKLDKILEDQVDEKTVFGAVVSTHLVKISKTRCNKLLLLQLS